MLNKNKKIKKVLLIVSNLLIIIFGAILYFYQYNLIKNNIINDIDSQNKTLTKSFNLLLDKLKTDISIKSDYILADEKLQKAFYEQNREALYKAVFKEYDQLTKENKYFKIMTFRLNDGSTFLRVHKPEMYGDKLNKKRKIILDTISSQKRQYGFEVGKLKMTYRIVSPVFYKGQQAGVVEIGVEPEYITEYIDQLQEIKKALFIKKESRSVSLDKTKLKGVDEFLFARGDKIFEDGLKHIDIHSMSNRLFIDNLDYIVTTLNLNNHKNETAAKLLMAYDISKYDEKFYELTKSSFVIMLVLIFVLSFILNIGINYFIGQIIRYYDKLVLQEKIVTKNSKLAAMGEMLESIAHQWRQPLSIISTSSTSVQLRKERGTLSDDQLFEICNTITNNTKYLSQTIDDFRGFFKNDKEKTVFSLEDVFEKTINLLLPKLKNKDIVIADNIDDIELYGYENELVQVLINLINNSRDELIKVEGKRFIFVDAYINCSDEDEVIIKIKDNAGGIPEKIIDKVFESHFTTKDSTGTGIGLYMSQKIILNSFNGFIEVKNIEFDHNMQSYKGAVFIVRLPYSLNTLSDD